MDVGVIERHGHISSVTGAEKTDNGGGLEIYVRDTDVGHLRVLECFRDTSNGLVINKCMLVC